ncbi:T9SS type A sorting domain-containing protein [Prolixibacteraceae bacterium]|nr:T9SS type A sorting domain-containing protein [Prolixibacteraceae bacterium]
MKRLSFLICLMVVFLSSLTTVAINPKKKLKKMPANQTYTWTKKTSTILQWTPGEEDDAYIRSTVPIAKRSYISALKANKNARANEAKVHVLSISSSPNVGHASRRTPHGYLSDELWCFSYWQYVYSYACWDINYSGPFNMTAPPADIIDAAHRNGVRAYGLLGEGLSSWYPILFKKELDGRFRVADKLIDACEYFGFDGYFYNFERALSPNQARSLREFLKYFEKASKQRGLDLSIHFYDALIESGRISYQNMLNDANKCYFQDGNKVVSDEFFLNYWWTWGGSSPTSSYPYRSGQKAKELGRSPYDVYSGIEVEMTRNDVLNTNANSRCMPLICPKGRPHNTSVGIFNPDATTWRRAKDMNDFYDRSGRFWVGQNHNPKNTVGPWHWKGIANYIPATTPITSVPFVTNFGTGHGQKFFENGMMIRNRPWSNRTFQDILPTWRWIVLGSGPKLNVGFDWDDAFYGSNCLKIDGNVTSQKEVRLYMSDLPVSSETNFQVVFKSGKANQPSNMKLALCTNAASDEWHFFPLGNSTTAEWNIKNIAIGQLAGKRIQSISLMVEGSAGSNYEMKIGRFSVLNETPVAPVAPSNLEVVNQLEATAEVASVSLSWDHSPDVDMQRIYYYNVYKKNLDGTRTHIGGSTCGGYFIQELKRLPNEQKVTIEVVAVSNDFAYSEPITIPIGFQNTSTPVARFNTDVTRVRNGGEVSFKSTSTGASAFEWTFEGGEPATSTDESPVVRYDIPGEYRVSLKAVNANGEDVIVKDNHITCYEVPEILMETKMIALSSEWETITLTKNYTKPVVVGTVTVPSLTTTSAVVRVKNVTNNSFQARLQVPSDKPLPQNYTTHFLVVEEGVYTQEVHEFKMEAKVVSSVKTSSQPNGYIPELRTYANKYTRPTIFGQVMSANNPTWTVCYTSSNAGTNPPTSTQLSVTKLVGEVSMAHFTEDVGYVVMEAGRHNYQGMVMQAGITTTSIKGMQNYVTAGATYTTLPGANFAAVTQAGVKGGNGGWPALLGSNSIRTTGLSLVCVEDQVNDEERNHLSENMYYLAMSTPSVEVMTPRSYMESSSANANENIQVTLYPNPVSSVLNISASYDFATDGKVIIRNILGQEVYMKPVARGYFYPTQIDVSSFDKGIYLFEIVEGNQVIYRTRIVKY